ncbi:MAG: basic secretory protein-like protein [Fimbriimonadaceae bacterium]
MIAAYLALGIVALQAPDLERHIYPLAKPLPAPKFVVDASDYPDGKAWGETAVALMEAWFPTLTSLLATEDYQPPETITLVVKKDLNVPAYAGGSTITVNGKWITERPDDLGMAIHELVHIIQAYPPGRNKPGWLVEGIADYIRWWRFEPEAPRPRIDPEKSKYTDAYRTTAYFLAWVSRRYDMRLVPVLDRAMRKGEDPVPLFEKMTGKDVDELWAEFIASRP